jgi:Cu/Ag efflux pump CusA
VAVSVGLANTPQPPLYGADSGTTLAVAGTLGFIALLGVIAAGRGVILYDDWKCGFRNCVVVKGGKLSGARRRRRHGRRRR